MKSHLGLQLGAQPGVDALHVPLLLRAQLLQQAVCALLGLPLLPLLPARRPACQLLTQYIQPACTSHIWTPLQALQVEKLQRSAELTEQQPVQALLGLPLLPLLPASTSSHHSFTQCIQSQLQAVQTQEERKGRRADGVADCE